MTTARDGLQAGRVPSWTLADRLRKARENAALSQQELAEATGISRRSISAYEGGSGDPKRPALLAWSLTTGVSYEWLKTGEASAGDEGPGGGQGRDSRRSAVREATGR